MNGVYLYDYPCKEGGARDIMHFPPSKRTTILETLPRRWRTALVWRSWMGPFGLLLVMTCVYLGAMCFGEGSAST